VLFLVALVGQSVAVAKPRPTQELSIERRNLSVVSTQVIIIVILVLAIVGLLVYRQQTR
jgi:hypothetical protein